MTTARTIPLPGYPTVRLTQDGKEMTVRPLVPDDKQALIEFFSGMPEEERFYLKDDVTSSSVIDQWIERMDYSHVLPLVATMDGKFVPIGSLRNHVKDIDGTAHDLVILELDVKLQVRDEVYL